MRAKTESIRTMVVCIDSSALSDRRLESRGRAERTPPTLTVFSVFKNGHKPSRDTFDPYLVDYFRVWKDLPEVVPLERYRT